MKSGTIYRVKTAGGTYLPTIFKSEREAASFISIYRVRGFIERIEAA